MLCYYEDIGLIKSTRKDDYAYRVYDEDAVKRLQQIIILRKLQIPMKQIKDVLNNQNAVAVIEIFKQNIRELDEQITALSAIKSILARFIDELQRKADVRLKLDILNDKTMLAVMSSLSFPENKIKEKVSMKELNKANESLSKLKDGDVMIINLPKCKAISSGWQWWDDLFVEGGFSKWMWANKHLHKEAFFSTAVYCVDKKADFHDDMACMNFIIHDHVTKADAEPYKIIDFEGGWYAYMGAAVSDGEYCDAIYHSKVRAD